MSEIRRLYGWPGIALSGHGMESDLRMSAESGFNTHLIKPVDASQLREAIQMALEDGINVTQTDQQQQTPHIQVSLNSPSGASRLCTGFGASSSKSTLSNQARYPVFTYFPFLGK
jgi:DNA-binding response OmpR family regulator